MTDAPERPASGPDERTRGSEGFFAVALPPATAARDVLSDPVIAEALGYAFLHGEETEFTRSFRERVRRQAEIYEHWLDANSPPPPNPSDPSDPSDPSRRTTR